MARKKTSNKKVSPKSPVYESYVDKLESQVQSNQSRLSMILGALIILVVGILVFNYFNKNNKADLGPAQQTEMQQQDVSPESLPGKYTVKENDTLFTIAQKYYNDGYKYTEIVTANNLASADVIEVGQVLEIPKVEGISVSEEPQASSTPAPVMAPVDTEWGSKITTNSYTVVEGDWLSKIAGRAYGDIYAYQKIAEANKIVNPDAIEVGTVLTIPR